MRKNRLPVDNTIMLGSGKVRLIYNKSFETYLEDISPSRAILITDENVYNLYRNDRWPAEIIIIGTGEGIKNLKTMEFVYKRLLYTGADRYSTIIGVGGGIVCDIAGFAASTYNRGLGFGLVPTTLLAQVDASIGGKNGVNFEGYKNIIGSFYQPDFILFDSLYLKTLAKEHILCGIAESVKHALAGSKKLFEMLEKEKYSLLSMEEEAIKRLVMASSAVKIEIVQKDEKEQDLRRILNFGHTFGHSIEREYSLDHGEAVASGMLIALKISRKLGYLQQGVFDRISRLFDSYNFSLLPVMDKDRVFQSLRKDKKKQGKAVHFVFLRDIGDAFVRKIPLDELSAIYMDI
jgi:3-dehydroquinate synthase